MDLFCLVASHFGLEIIWIVSDVYHSMIELGETNTTKCQESYEVESGLP